VSILGNNPYLAHTIHFISNRKPAVFWCFCERTSNIIPGVGLMVRVVGLGSQDPEFKSHSAV